MKKTIVILSSLAVIILSAVGIYYTLQNNNNVIPVEVSSSSSAPAPAPSESSSLSISIPPIVPQADLKSNSSSKADKKPEEEKIVTYNNGKTEIKTIPNYKASEPTPPPPPPKPEGSTSDPNSKPTYKPDDTIITPPASSEPKDGTKNDKGEIYIKGFGWVEPVTENKHDVVSNAGTGEIIGK